MDNLDLIYEVKSNKLDKRKSWYYRKENIVFLTGEQFRNFNYILEAKDYNKDSYNLIIILSKDKIDDRMIRINRDSYGRLKYRPISFRSNFAEIAEKDYNVEIEIHRQTDNYVAFKLCI